MNQNNRCLLNVLLIFVIFLSISGFLEDLKNTFQYGGVDLRNRVVGARLLRREIDPYFYKWQTGDPLELLDPRDKAENEVNMVTVPPSLLLLLSPFAEVRYDIQRVVWFVIQWLLLLLSVFLIAETAGDEDTKKMVWLLSLFFIGSSFFWRLHVERGQIYIFYTALLSVIYHLEKKHKSTKIGSSIILGIAVILRPTLIFMTIPFLLYKRWKLIRGTIYGGLTAFSLSLILAGWKVWQSYFSAMKIHGAIHLSDIHYAASSYPHSNIEGIGNLYGLANIPIFDSSIQELLKSLGIILPGYVLLIAFLLLVVCGVAVVRKKKIRLTNDQQFLAGLLLAFLVDFFLPAPRFPYNNVMFLPILAILVLEQCTFLSGSNTKQ